MKGLPLSAFIYVLEHVIENGELQHKILPNFISLLFPPVYSKIKLSTLIKDIEALLPTSIITSVEKSLNQIEVLIDKEKVAGLIRIILEDIMKRGGKVISAGLSFKKELNFVVPYLIVSTTFSSLENLKVISVFKILPIPVHFLNDCWCVASKGGKIEFSGNHVMIDFSGLRNIYIERFWRSDYIDLIQEIENQNIKTYEQLRTKLLKEELISIKEIFKEIETFLTKSCLLYTPLEVLIDSSIPLIYDSHAKWSAIFLINFTYTSNIPNLQHSFFQLSYLPQSRRIEVKNIFKTNDFNEKTEMEIKNLISVMRSLSCDCELWIRKYKSETELETKHYERDKLGLFIDSQVPYWEFLSLESKEILRRISFNFNIPEQHPFINEIIKFELMQSLANFFTSPPIANISSEFLQEGKKNISSEIKKFLERIAKNKIKRADLKINNVLALFELIANNSNYFERLKSAFKFTILTLQDLKSLCEQIKSPSAVNVDTLRKLCLFLMEIRK